jgi:hypothetical protein
MGLWRVAGIESGSWARAAALWLVLLAVTASGELGAETLRALLLNRAGSDALPPAFILEAVVKLAAIPAYYALSHRISNRRLMAVTIAVYLGVMFFAGVAPAELVDRWLVPAYALEAVAQNLLVLHWGVYLVDFFTVRESTSSFAFIYSAQPLGALVAGVLLMWHPFGRLADLLYVAALFSLAGLMLAARAGHRLAESPRLLIGPGGAVPTERGAAWRYVLSAPVVRAMAVATAVMVLARALLQVAGSHVLSSEYVTEGSMGEFLGQYKVWTNLAVFAVQAVGAARLMRRFSPTRVNLSYSGLTLAAFGVLAALPGTGTLVFAQLVHQELKAILKTPFSALMYGAMADYARPEARMAVLGVVVPVAGVLSGLLMMGLKGAGIPAAGLAPAGCVASLLFIGVTVWQNRAYQLALVELLRDKLGFRESLDGRSSSLLRIPDARVFEIRKVRARMDYVLVRGRWARKLFPDLFDVGVRVDMLDEKALLERLDELLLLVELYRPSGTPYLKPLLAEALRDGRVDLLDNALETAANILPPGIAAHASLLVEEGMRRNAVAGSGGGGKK